MRCRDGSSRVGSTGACSIHDPHDAGSVMRDRFDSHSAVDHPGPGEPVRRTEHTDRTPSLPAALAKLLQAADQAGRARAWTEFLQQYSKLLLKVAHRASTTYDEAMDAYTFMLDQLRQDDHRRLRRFAADGRGRFTTWLVVVARRLCVDHHRRVHGRPQADPGSDQTRAIQQEARRNLVALIAGEADPDRLEDSRSSRPDAAVYEAERQQALTQAISTLDEADQLLLALRFEDDLPLGSIGPLVGLASRFQVHRRLKAVLARLRGELEKRGFTGS